jgi:Flp pilus assembly protein TadB
MDPAIILTVLAIMALTGTLTLAAWRTINRPAGGDRFEDALSKITGGRDVDEDTSLAKNDRKGSLSWDEFWLNAVTKSGRPVNDPSAPGRIMIGVAVLALFFGLFVFPGGVDGLETPIVVLGLIWVWLGYEQGKRKAGLEKQLPLLLSGLRTQMNAGMTIQAALLNIADDLPAPLGDEIRQVKSDVSVSIPLDQALESLAKRVKSRLLQFLVSSIGIALRSGSDLIPQLITIEEIVRSRARIQGKIRSALALARPTSYIAMSAPVLMAGYLFISNPDYPAYFFGPGLWLFGICAIMYAAGVFVVRLLVSNVDKV